LAQGLNETLCQTSAGDEGLGPVNFLAPQPWPHRSEAAGAMAVRRRRSAAAQVGWPGCLALVAAVATFAARGRVAFFASSARPPATTTVGRWRTAGARPTSQTPPPSAPLLLGGAAIFAGAALAAAAARAGGVRDAHRIVRHFIDDSRSAVDPEFDVVTEAGLPELVGLKVAPRRSGAATGAAPNQIFAQATEEASAAAGEAEAEQPQTRLNAALANGRLALLATLAAPLVNGIAGLGHGQGLAASCRRATEQSEASPAGAGVAEVEPASSADPEYEEEEEWDIFNDDAPPFEPSAQPGACPPLGYFDPLGFCKQGDMEGFRFKRAAELKHGRVCMMASVGCIVEHYVQIPGFNTGRTSFGATWNAVFMAPGIYIFCTFLFSLMVIELSLWSQQEDKEPGNFGDPFGVGMYTTDMRNKELNNGRFAMFVMVGIISAELYTGKDAVQQLGL